MSNDLISKKSLLKDLDSVIAQYNWKDDGVIMDILTCVRDMVCDHPTAYDIDMVVKRLKQAAWSLGSDDVIEHYCVDLVDAIEIVKGGAM